jgi:DNA repair protein RadC
MNQTQMDIWATLPTPSRDIACSEQPQQRIESFGPGALSDTELLALLLQTGAGAREALVTSSRLVADAGSLAGLTSWQRPDFQRLEGIGPVKARQLTALVEIARRMAASGEEAPILNRPELIAQYFMPITRGLEVEKFWVACLNRKNRLKKLVAVTSGTATSSLAHPREVFREAIREGATAVVCIHNHPSGDPAPSAADVQVTRQLRDASKAVDIDLLDHVVIGRPSADPRGTGWYSFREAGVI